MGRPIERPHLKSGAAQWPDKLSEMACPTFPAMYQEDSGPCISP